MEVDVFEQPLIRLWEWANVGIEIEETNFHRSDANVVFFRVPFSPFFVWRLNENDMFDLR
jgi:hypothetical protein